jgi:hypothetical protein
LTVGKLSELVSPNKVDVLAVVSRNPQAAIIRAAPADVGRKEHARAGRSSLITKASSRHRASCRTGALTGKLGEKFARQINVACAIYAMPCAMSVLLPPR